MLSRLVYILVILLALPVWLLGLALPITWLVAAGVHQTIAPAGASSLTHTWQLKLYASSLLLMTLSSLVAMTLATLATYAFARISRLTIIWITAGILVVPPLVYGYLWFLTLGNRVLLQSLPVPFNLPVPNLGNLLLAAWAIGLWLWPIPALLLTAGWQWTGKPAWLLARMDSSDLRAFVRAGLPAMRPYTLAAAAMCLLLSAQEYAIPALFSVQTWQTQWLELARAGIPLGQLAIAALPPAALLLCLILVFVRFWRSIESLGPSDLGTVLPSWKVRLSAWTMLLVIISLATVIPAIGAIHSLTKPLTLNTQRFHDEFINTPIIMTAAATLALATALLAVPIGQRRHRSTLSDKSRDASIIRPSWSVRRIPSLRRFSISKLMLVLAIACWVLPLSLMAESGKQAETAFVALVDTLGRISPVIGGALSQMDLYGRLDILLWISILAGRMVPIAWLLVAMVARSLPANLSEQAAVDGAAPSQILQRILLPLLAPAAAAAWLICSLLIATDTIAAVMLQPPGFQVLAVSMLNQMHYGRDGDIVATCLLALATAAMAGTVAAVTLGRRASARD